MLKYSFSYIFILHPLSIQCKRWGGRRLRINKEMCNLNIWASNKQPIEPALFYVGKSLRWQSWTNLLEACVSKFLLHRNMAIIDLIKDPELSDGLRKELYYINWPRQQVGSRSSVSDTKVIFPEILAKNSRILSTVLECIAIVKWVIKPRPH